MAIYGGTLAVICGCRRRCRSSYSASGSAVRDLKPDGLGRVERRAAAQPHDAVAEVLPVHADAVQHVLFGGIGRRPP